MIIEAAMAPESAVGENEDDREEKAPTLAILKRLIDRVTIPTRPKRKPANETLAASNSTNSTTAQKKSKKKKESSTNASKLANNSKSLNKTKRGRKNLTRDERVALWNAIEANLTKA